MAAIKVSAGAGVSSKGMTVERPTPVITYITAGRMKFLKACWTEIFNSLTVGGSSLESIFSSLPCGKELANASSGSGDSLLGRKKLQYFVS